LSALEGFNATIFAYGQTGSGKTFTITGGAERYVDRGIIPRSLSLIFSEIEKKTDVQFTTHISYLEIYNDSGYDLLDPSHDSKGMEDLPRVTLMEDEDGNVHLRNLSMHVANTEEDALNLLFLGDTNRAISETAMNLASSRSHCIFTISLEMRQTGSDVIRRSKLHLVDLAGSERVHKTSASGQLLREAKHINSSLHYLEMVIVALHERNSKGRQHIPYRNSMMTNVLRDSLGGNCKTSMVATVSADKSNTEESISTCRFAQRVALVQNDALVNEEIDPSMLIKRLKAEVVSLREELAFTKGERSGEPESGEKIDSLEFSRLQRLIMEWVQQSQSESKFENDDKLQPGPLTYDRIHACFDIFRTMSRGKSAMQDQGSDDQVKQLTQQIQQRDNEIAILVNMVKQGKDQDLQETKVISNTSKPIPSGILADKEKAFDYFKNTYSQRKAIEEHKQLLKEKYSMAKQTGELVNVARGDINRLKNEIDLLRTQNAVQGVMEGKEMEDHELEGKMTEINVHKKTYRENFQNLKDLKKEIERVQAFLGKSRDKMQSDFDSWYRVMLRQAPESNREEDEVLQHYILPTKSTLRMEEMPLTGNQQADDDIMAFYKAKEQLLRRHK